jgi:hypothetical protein
VFIKGGNNKMLEELKKEFNKTETLNGDLAFKSTISKLLDFFSSCGAMRKTSNEKVINSFLLAFNEDKDLALKCLFYARDRISGLGERRLFRIIINYMADAYPDILTKNLPYIAEFGRFDDLLILLNTKVEESVISLIKEQLNKDLKSDKPSLLGKWLPSENTSSKETKLQAKYLRKKLGLAPTQYRKTLSALRKKINVLERLISAKEWSSIEYEKIPSKAGLNYRKAFFKHDQERYSNFLDGVSKGEKKINSKTLYPYELYDKCKGNDKTIEEMWKALPNYVNKKENAIVVADVSGSMSGRPMSVSVSLALYFAERNKGKFANHFITFSNKPELVEIIGNSLYEKIKLIEKSNWNSNTDLIKVFDLILHTAVKNNVPQEELPKRIYIISDMQFDFCINIDKTSLMFIKESFQEKGYTLPEVVFWNVNDHGNKPITTNDKGVQLVSGFSTVVFEQVVSGLSAYELMIKILKNEKYSKISCF